MKECPRCYHELPDNARQCDCGWKDRKTTYTTSEPRVKCAHDTCLTDATVKVRVETGAWANFCQLHLEAWHHAKAERYCTSRGLDTHDKRKAHLKTIISKYPTMRAYERQPGEDPYES